MTGESIGVCEAISGADPDGLSAEQQERLARLLDDCLQRLEQDRPVDPRRLIAEHPDLAGPLEACLRNLEFLRVAAGELAPNRCDSRPPLYIRA